MQTLVADVDSLSFGVATLPHLMVATAVDVDHFARWQPNLIQSAVDVIEVESAAVVVVVAAVAIADHSLNSMTAVVCLHCSNSN